MRIETPMNASRIETLKAKIEELRQQLPAHSVPPAMLIELEDLEDELAAELEEAKRREREGA